MVFDNTEEVENDDGIHVKKVSPGIQLQAGILLEKSANVLAKAAKIKGLLEKDKVENLNKWKVAPNVIFTDDISALELMRETEETDYENVK